MERNWKSPLLSLTFNFQPNANSIPQLLLRKPRNDYLSSARYYDSSNSRPNVIRIYIYIYPCKLLVSYLTDDWRAKKRGSSRLQTYRTIEPRVEVFAANQPRLPPPLPPPPPPEKESNTFRLPRYSSRPSPGTSLNDDEWRVRKKERIRRSVVSFVDVTVQTSFP